NPRHRRWRQRGFNRIEKRVQKTCRGQVGIARVDVDIEVGVEGPHDWRSQRLGCRVSALFAQEEGGLLCRCEIGPMPQSSVRAGEARRTGGERPERRIYWLTN